MAQSLLVTLREGLEAALIVAIILAYLKSMRRERLTLNVGLAAAAVLGFVFYRGARRLDLRLFFNVTEALLIVFAAGLLAHGIHELQEARVLPVVVEHVWDTNGFLSDNEGPGEWLKGLLGYNGNPSAVEVVAYPLFLATAFWYFLRAAPSSSARHRSPGRPG